VYRSDVTSGDDQRSEEERPSFRNDQVALVAAAHGFHDVFSGFLVPLLPLLIKRHRLSLTLAGTLTLLQRFPSLANPLFGALVDRLRLKPFLVLAPVVTAASMSLIGNAPSYLVLAALLLLAGVSVAALHVPGPVFVARYAGGQVGRGMSWFMVGGEGARTLAPIVALAAASAWTVEGIWRLAPLALVMGALLQWRLVEPPRRGARPDHGGSLGETWRRLRRPFAGIVGIIIARSFAVAAMTTFLPSYLTSRGASLWFAGISLSVLEAAGAVGTLGAGSASDRFGRRRVLAVALLALPPLMLAFTMLDGWWLFPLLCAIGLTTFATNPVMMALVQDHAGDHPALANGLYMALNFALRASIVVGVGAMGDAFGLERTYLYCALAALVGVPFVWLVPRR
jgi:FSR family fosmidomycin resistance protein-like MFS transporter